MEAPIGVEPMMKVLQTSALPLGYGAGFLECSLMGSGRTAKIPCLSHRVKRSPAVSRNFKRQKLEHLTRLNKFEQEAHEDRRINRS